MSEKGGAAQARAAILRSTAGNTPLAVDVDLDALAVQLEGTPQRTARRCSARPR